MPGIALFFARFSDGGLYATGEQTAPDGSKVPGGPIGYVLRSDAETMARAIAGTVVERSCQYAIDWCKEKHCTLWIRKAGGGMMYVDGGQNRKETDRALLRVDGGKRQAAIEASRHLS